MTAHDPPNTSRMLARHSCQLYKQSSCQHGCNIPTRWVSGRRITANPTPPPCRTKPDPAASTFPCQHSKPPQAMPSTRHRPSLPHFDTLGRTLSLHCRHVRSPAIHATHRAIVPSVGTRLKPPITRNHSRRRIHVPGAHSRGLLDLSPASRYSSTYAWLHEKRSPVTCGNHGGHSIALEPIR